MLTNRSDEKKFYRSVDTFESANLRERKMQFLYSQGMKVLYGSK